MFAPNQLTQQVTEDNDIKETSFESPIEEEIKQVLEEPKALVERKESRRIFCAFFFLSNKYKYHQSCTINK